MDSRGAMTFAVKKLLTRPGVTISDLWFQFMSVVASRRLMFKRPLIGWVFTVHMDRPHKTEFVLPELFGDSVGHWEGNTLVVDTINLGGHAVISETEPHSQSLHVVQRMSRPTYDSLVVDIMVDDPRAFQQPAAFHTTFRLDNSVEFNEAQCWYDGGGAPMAHAPE